jgi:hypothetical protein
VAQQPRPALNLLPNGVHCRGAFQRGVRSQPSQLRFRLSHHHPTSLLGSRRPPRLSSPLASSLPWRPTALRKPKLVSVDAKTSAIQSHGFQARPAPLTRSSRCVLVLGPFQKGCVSRPRPLVEIALSFPLLVPRQHPAHTTTRSVGRISEPYVSWSNLPAGG